MTDPIATLEIAGVQHDLAPNFPAIVIRNSAGTKLFEVSAGGAVTQVLRIPDGAAATPALAFAGDTNTGFYWQGADRIGVALGGTRSLEFRSGGIQFFGGGGLWDLNNNEVLLFVGTTSAVNEITITNAATGNGVILAASGGDTNIDLNVRAKGSGVVRLGSQLANYLSVAPVASGSTPALTVSAVSDTNVALGLTPKGTGGVVITSPGASALAVGRLGATTPAFQVDASATTSITGLKVTAAAASGGVAVTAIGETNVALTLNAAGSGTITIGSVSTGAVAIHRATTITDAVTVNNADEGRTAGLNVRSLRELVTLSGATKDTTFNIPSGAILLGASFNVDTAVVDDAGNDTWSAAYVTGATTVLASGAAAAQNTKVNTLVVPEKASNTTNIRFTPNGGSFSAGVIEVVAYYIDLTSLANA